MVQYRPRCLTKSILFPSLLILAFLTLAACGYVGYYTRQAHRQQTFRYFPSVSALNEIRPEDSLILSGTIVRLQKREEPLLLVAVSSKYQQNEKVDLVQLQVASDSYMAFLPPGNYDLYVFADLDGDGDFDSEELVGRASAVIAAGHPRNDAIVQGPAIVIDREHPQEAAFRVNEKVRPTSYVYTSLDDEFFDTAYGTTGLFNPASFIAHTQGFLFSLEKYDDAKTTVLFIHGISGTPRDWKFIAEGLDRSRFQPFFFYYPSGLPLDKLGTLLSQIISTIDRHSITSRRKIVLAAHSMGGLVALSAINKLAADGFPASLKLYCSFSTPYAGDEEARRGVETAPLVVPVWRDIAARSEFLQDLVKNPFPKQLPFYLYFSYKDTSRFKLGETSDGAVTLRSQLVPSLQSAARGVLGFNETHMGILNSEAARESFLRLLDMVTPRGSNLHMGANQNPWTSSGDLEGWHSAAERDVPRHRNIATN